MIPERRLFERDRETPSAAIVLKLMGDLDPSQVRAIRHLVASAVEGLKPERVSIVDLSILVIQIRTQVPVLSVSKPI